jgi:hypothetical protein
MRRKKTKTRKRTPFAVGREKFQETAAFKEASRRGGRMTGAKMRDSGQIYTIATPSSRSKAGKIGGPKRFNLHGSPATPEDLAKGGRIQGAVNAENGHMRRIAHQRWHPEIDFEDCVKCSKDT